MLGLVWSFCFFHMVVGSSLQGNQVCAEVADEALELRQVKKSTKHGDAKASTDSQSIKDFLSPSWREAGFEKSILEESHLHKIKFRARHKNWTDILELHSDGFFQRYHSHDAGVWSVNKNELTLNWLGWGGEVLRSTDGGQTFRSPEVNFALRSYTQPRWWKKHFDNIAFMLQNDTFSAVNATAIIAAHINGWNVDLNEKGYQAIAHLKDKTQMRIFVRRLVHNLGMGLKDEGGLEGVLPYYNGQAAVQTFSNLAAELKRTADGGEHRWVTFLDKATQEFN
mmetsp:Transcript_124168/g.215229  ORF Transcript_124168/g.215229 Transcript_124168/m.215229 type:complete len:281 (-) Transcript_124168:25-867(-)